MASFIHELTHAWQIAHKSAFSLICDDVSARAGELAGKEIYYDYPRPGIPWSEFGLEQQAAIVDEWFGGTRHARAGHPAGTGMQMDANDRYLIYTTNNIWLGSTA